MGGGTGTRSPRVFLAVLAAVALAVLVIAGWAASASEPGSQVWIPAGVILVLHVVARRFPFRVGGRNRVESTACTAFGFALLLTVPVPIAVLGLATAALVPPPEAHRRNSWRRHIFEVARATVVFAAAGTTITLISRGLGIAEVTAAWHLLVVLAPAGALAYAIDATLSAWFLASVRGGNVRTVFLQDRDRLDLLAYLMLVGFAPFVVVIAERALLLAPFLLIASIALHRAAGSSANHQHGALHDALTGLPNRRQLELRIGELVVGGGPEARFALLLMDLDRFTEVNEQLGHDVGDELLEMVAQRLRGIEEVDLVARIGGDEFAFVVRGVGSDAQALDLGDRIQARVKLPLVVRGIRVRVAGTIGIALHPDHGLDAAALLRRADSATYGAKRDGVPVGLATHEPSQASPGRVSLVGELEGAMRRDELHLEYQPKVCLHSNEVVGLESLLRWHHPVHGLIPPDAFVGTVEHTDLIAPLTRHVLRRALADLQTWARSGERDVNVAVNISTRDLQDTRFPREVLSLLRDHAIAPSALTLEITETALQIDPERAAAVLRELREVGVRLSIDDFGTGYSSLAALRHLPVCELKIDRVFVAAMADDQAGRAIVRSMVQLAHALQLEVVAEGVESEAIAAELRSFGCDVIQGYVVDRPLPAHLVVGWLQARRDELTATRAVPFARVVRDISRTRTKARAG